MAPGPHGRGRAQGSHASHRRPFVRHAERAGGPAAGVAENTLAAFRRAIESGADMVELDVQCTRDRRLVVFHDATLRRTTNGAGFLARKTYAQISRLDSGCWFSEKFAGEKIPSLREALEWLASCDMQANIEIKPYTGFTAPTTIATLTEINRYWPQDKPLPLVSSFNVDALRLCQSLAPEMPLGLLLSKWQENWEALAEELRCYSVHLSLNAATQSRVNEIKQKGYAVCVFTVNSKRKALKLLGWGVDAVFSDYPDLLG